MIASTCTMANCSLSQWIVAVDPPLLAYNCSTIIDSGPRAWNTGEKRNNGLIEFRDPLKALDM